MLKNQLFDLIRSMTQTEKRNFKIFATKYTRKEKSGYLKLFEAIDKLKTYDEKKILKSLKHEKFITRLAVEKNTLYNLILKNLGSFHSNISGNMQLKHLLLEVEILYKKSLYKQCQRHLFKAEKMALAYELQLQLLEIYKWQRTLCRTIGLNEDINLILKKEEIIIKEIENNQHYNKLFTSLVLLLSKHGYKSRKKEALEQLDIIRTNSLLINENNAISNSNKRIYHSIYAHLSLVFDKHKEAYYHNNKQIKLMLLIPDFIQNHIEQYMTIKYNNLICLMHIDKNEAFKQLALFRSIPEKKLIASNIKIRQFILSSYELELSLLINYHMFKEAKQLIPEIKDMLKNNENTIGLLRYFAIYYASSYVYFVLKEYSESVKAINEIINRQQESAISEELNAAARILNLFIHYETNNVELLPYLEKSTNRFLLKHEILYDTEKIILQFFRKTFLKGIDLSNQDLIKLKSELIEILKNPLEKHFLDRFDIISWLNSKIENRPFADILKEKFNQKIE